jgi:hypothetical protein
MIGCSSSGYGIVLVAESTTEGLISSELDAGGGRTPEDVAVEACEQLLREIAVVCHTIDCGQWHESERERLIRLRYRVAMSIRQIRP